MDIDQEERGVKRPNPSEPHSETDTLEITPLGAGNEVGRSCVLMKFKGKTIMLDCGIHPAHTGFSALPYFDELEDPSTVDLLLVSHFHLDHIASLPYLLGKTTFKGKVFMTHPTKAIYKLLLTDYIRVSNLSVDEMLFDEQDLNRTMDKIEAIDFHQEIERFGIKFWCYNAGHVLGAAMFMVEIAGVKVLYTGDYSRQEDRHLMAAEIPELCPDVLIVESTYGVQIHEPRKERESRFCNTIHNIVGRGGRCLIPVFALGRAQELLLILDEYWASRPELSGRVPIYYASSLGKKCMSVYQTYTNMMNSNIKTRANVSNPFNFAHIQELTNVESFEDSGPCVVMASPGMLQNGLSRQLFEMWCQSERNGVLLPGYCVEGTLAKTILSEPEMVETQDGRMVPRKLDIHYISFSAHSDFLGTSTFIDSLTPPNVILVHGEKNEMQRLQHALNHRYETKKMEILMPRNCQTVRLQFQGQKTAKAVGKIASQGPQHLASVSGLLVQKDFQYSLLDPTDLNTYTKLKISEITQSLKLNYTGTWAQLKFQIEQVYESVVETTVDDKLALFVHAVLYLVLTSDTELVMEWTSSPVNDMVADSIASLILYMGANPSSFVVPEPRPVVDVDQERFNLIYKLLTSFYSHVQADQKTKTIEINFDGTIALYKADTQTIECSDEALKSDLEQILLHSTFCGTVQTNVNKF